MLIAARGSGAPWASATRPRIVPPWASSRFGNAISRGAAQSSASERRFTTRPPRAGRPSSRRGAGRSAPMLPPERRPRKKGAESRIATEHAPGRIKNRRAQGALGGGTAHAHAPLRRKWVAIVREAARGALIGRDRQHAEDVVARVLA